MKRILVIISAVLLMASCKGEAISTERKADYELELLFEKDGCKMYRFYDGHYVYWTDCSGRTEYKYTTQSGKTTTTHHVDQITD